MGWQIAKLMADAKFFELETFIEKSYKSIRNIRYFVKQPHFPKLWEQSTPLERRRFVEALKRMDNAAISKWVNTHSSLEYADMTRPVLIELAKERRIKRAIHMSKPELIYVLEKYDGEEQSILGQRDSDIH